MNRTSQKLVSASLLAAILLAVASCGEGSKTPADTNSAVPTETAETAAVTEEAVPTDGLPEVNMNGWELSILNYTPDGISWANIMLNVEAETGDILNDALYYRNRDLSERFNLVLRADEVSTVQNYIGKEVMSGDADHDIFVMSETASLTSYLPYIMDWADIPYLRLDQPWWNPDATSVYNISGKQTALAGNMTLTALSRAVCMVFNKNIWREYGDGETNFYQLVDENQWIFDKYLEITRMVHKDLNGDGVMDEKDLYGLHMGRGFKGYIASFLAASATNFTEKNKNGEDVFTLHQNERGLNVITKLMDALSYEGYYYNIDPDVHSSDPSDLFKTGHSLFTQAVPNDIYKLRDMNDDIGILPMPKYDTAQEKFYAAAWGGAVWTLAKSFDMECADNLGIALEAMCFDTYYNVVPVFKEVALKTKSTRDNESEKMLDIIFDSIYFDFGTNLMYDSIIAGSILTTFWKNKSSDGIVSTIEKVLPQMEKFIVTLNEKAAEIE